MNFVLLVLDVLEICLHHVTSIGIRDFTCSGALQLVLEE